MKITGKDCNFFKHGGHSAIAKFRKGQIDFRTQQGRFLKATRAKFVSDLGGHLSTAQEVILDRIMEELLFLSIIAHDAETKGSDIVQQGKLIPALGENYIAFTNCLARNVRLLYELQAKNMNTFYDSPREIHRRAIMGEI